MSSKGKSRFPLLPLTTGICFHAILIEDFLSKTRRSVSSRPILIILLPSSFSLYRRTVRGPVSPLATRKSCCLFNGIDKIRNGGVSVGVDEANQLFFHNLRRSM